MITWPAPLISEIADRRCIAFIGAGLSHFATGVGSKKPPLWGELLALLRVKMRTPADRALVDELIAKERFLDAAEIIRSDMTDAEYNAFIQYTMRDPNYQPAKVHELLRDIDLKIVITTNYDTIYEDCCRVGAAPNSYNIIRYHDPGLIDDVRSRRRLIVKAHGCATAQPLTILRRSDYFRARKDYPYFFEILDALFTSHTLLFLGYSVGDPDIQLILENVAIRTRGTNPHYIVTAEGSHPALKAAMQKSYDLHFLEHEAGRYEQIEGALSSLLGEVAAERLKHP